MVVLVRFCVIAVSVVFEIDVVVVVEPVVVPLVLVVVIVLVINDESSTTVYRNLRFVNSKKK